MEFFTCPCPQTGNVILDGIDQGPNKDATGNLLTKQCNTGQHTISLTCANGYICTPPQVTIVIANTNPILPMGVPFT